MSTLNMEANKIKNPITGRMISIGGDTYNKLIAQGYTLANNTLYPPPQLPTPNIYPSLSPTITVPLPTHQYKPQIPIPQQVPMPQQYKPQIPMHQQQYKPQIPIPQQVPIPQQLYKPPIPIPQQVPISQQQIPMPQQQYKPQILIPQQQIVVPGNIPTIDVFEQEMKMLEKEEEEQRVRMCGICKEYYIDRWRPFTIPELGNLSKIIQACNKCGELCDAKYYRRGITNAKECQQYKTAATMGQKQVNRLDAELRVKAINAAEMAGKDIGQFFPQVPK